MRQQHSLHEKQIALGITFGDAFAKAHGRCRPQILDFKKS
jgi:hypothetical protein